MNWSCRGCTPNGWSPGSTTGRGRCRHMCRSVSSPSASSTETISRKQADVGCKREDQPATRTVSLKAKTDPAAATRAVTDNYKDYTVCDLTTPMEDGRYVARAAVVGRGGGRTLSQRFLDFETFDTEAKASARAQAGARVWIDEEMWDAPLALPSYYTTGFVSERKAESVAT